MNRVSDLTLRRATVAVVFLCVMALTLCQVLGPTARLHAALARADVTGQAFGVATIHSSGSHSPQPSRCASIKLAPIEIKTTDFERAGTACGPAAAFGSIPPHSTELGVPTPPPRMA